MARRRTRTACVLALLAGAHPSGALAPRKALWGSTSRHLHQLAAAEPTAVAAATVAATPVTPVYTPAGGVQAFTWAVSPKASPPPHAAKPPGAVPGVLAGVRTVVSARPLVLPGVTTAAEAATAATAAAPAAGSVALAPAPGAALLAGTPPPALAASAAAPALASSMTVAAVATVALAPPLATPPSIAAATAAVAATAVPATPSLFSKPLPDSLSLPLSLPLAAARSGGPAFPPPSRLLPTGTTPVTTAPPSSLLSLGGGSAPVTQPLGAAAGAGAGAVPAPVPSPPPQVIVQGEVIPVSVPQFKPLPPPPVYYFVPPPPTQLLHPKWAVIFMLACLSAILAFCYTQYKQQLREVAATESASLLGVKPEGGGAYGSTGRRAEEGGNTDAGGNASAGAGSRRAPPVAPRGVVRPGRAPAASEDSSDLSTAAAARRGRRPPSRQAGPPRGKATAAASRGRGDDDDDLDGEGTELKEPAAMRAAQGRRPQSAPPGDEDGNQAPSVRQTLLKRAASTAARPLGYLWGTLAGGGR